MPRTLDPFRLLLFAVAGSMNHKQEQVIDYLREENRILHEHSVDGRLRFDDEQRRRIAVRAKMLGRRVLSSRAGAARNENRRGLKPEPKPPERTSSTQRGTQHPVTASSR